METSSSSSVPDEATQTRRPPPKRSKGKMWLPPGWFFRVIVLGMIAGYFIGVNWWLYNWLGLSDLGGLLAFLIFNFLISMTTWSYLSASYMDPGSPPREWEPASDVAYGLPSVHSEDGTSPQYRHCVKCDLPKPPRTHHCSICDRCILKMDHHCPWVANCVGHKNHKSFVLFLFYAVVASTSVFACVVYRFVTYVKIKELTARDAYIAPDSFVSLMVLGALLLPTVFSVLPLFVLHIWLAFTNMTTLEMNQYDRFKRAMRISGSPARLKRLRYPFDHGPRQNVKAFFGSSFWNMFIPGEAPGDGMLWPVREDFVEILKMHEQHVKEVQQRADSKRQKQQQKQKEPLLDSDSDTETTSLNDEERLLARDTKSRLRANAEIARMV